MTSLLVRARRSRTAVAVATPTTFGRLSLVGATVGLWWTKSSINHGCGTYVSLVFYAEHLRQQSFKRASCCQWAGTLFCHCVGGHKTIFATSAGKLQTYWLKCIEHLRICKEL